MKAAKKSSHEVSPQIAFRPVTVESAVSALRAAIARLRAEDPSCYTPLGVDHVRAVLQEKGIAPSEAILDVGEDKSIVSVSDAAQSIGCDVQNIAKSMAYIAAGMRNGG